MPYKSKAQEAYFNVHRKELEKQGVNVDEWNQSSQCPKNLPEHVAPKPKAKRVKSKVVKKDHWHLKKEKDW
jgi:hypothetical protein